jgi:hypothetical protein
VSVMKLRVISHEQHWGNAHSLVVFIENHFFRQTHQRQTAPSSSGSTESEAASRPESEPEPEADPTSNSGKVTTPTPSPGDSNASKNENMPFELPGVERVLLPLENAGCNAHLIGMILDAVVAGLIPDLAAEHALGDWPGGQLYESVG